MLAYYLNKSFITEKFACDLHVQRTGTMGLDIAAFGEMIDRLQHVDTTTIYLLTEQKTCIPFNVLIVSSIIASINTSLQHRAASLPHLKNLQLTHPATANEQFDILILVDTDYYWNVILDEGIRGDGPTTVKSKIGYI